MALTDAKVKNAKPGDKQYKIYDEKGLFVIVRPDGGKWWRFRYRVGGKEQTLSLGTYPDVSLKEAREKRKAALNQLDAGDDPAALRKSRKKKVSDENCKFKSVAERWMVKNKGWADSTRYDTERRLLNHVYPVIELHHVNEIEKEDLTRLINAMTTKGLHSGTMRKIFQHIDGIFKYAIAEGLCGRNIARDVEPLLPSGDPVKNRPALLESDVPIFLRKLDEYGSFQTAIALRLLIVTAARPGNVFSARWAEFDLDNAVWSIPGERMKMRRIHYSPIPKRLLEDLKLLYQVTGTREYLFPSQSKPATHHMSENTLNLAVKRMGFDATSHGMRSVFSTMLNERGYNPDAVEVQLAHIDKNTVRAAYNRGKYWDERVNMLQDWEDWLFLMKTGGNVLDFKKRA